MNEKRKRIVYGVLATLVAVLCIAFSLLLNARDKKAIKDIQTPTVTPIISPMMDLEQEPTETVTPTAEPTLAVTPEEREIGQSDTQFAEGKKELEKEIKSSKPKFMNVTGEIEKEFLANDLDKFWRELGLYIIGTLGNQPVSEVTFIEMYSSKDNMVNCPIEVKDPSGDALFIMASYNTEYKYYEFHLTTDVYTYDTSPETGEGGL